MSPPYDRPVRVLRVIARMNVGGPAHHVSVLSGLDARDFRTVLVTGRPTATEGTLESLAHERGADLRIVGALRPEIRPMSDVRALGALIRIIRSFRPDIVHTHTAKAGLLGRTAAILAARRRPIIVHTYHGHVLEGYFGPAKTAVFRTLERILALVSDRLLSVSDATVDDLVRLGIAPRSAFDVVRIGLDLEDLLNTTAADGSSFRRELGLSETSLLAGFVGRLVPIKRVDILLQGLACARARGARWHLAVVGDGELRPELEQLAGSLGIGDSVRFVGYRTDLTHVLPGFDLAVLTSDNEGTPVALVEAAAAGRPSLATRVGGVPEILDDRFAILVPPRDPTAIGDGLVALADNRERLIRMSESARTIAARFTSARLLDDMEALYRELLKRPVEPSTT